MIQWLYSITSSNRKTIIFAFIRIFILNIDVRQLLTVTINFPYSNLIKENSE